MKRVLWNVLCCMLTPCLSMADDILLSDQAKIAVDFINPTQTTTIQSGPVSLNFSDASVQSISLENYPSDTNPSLFVGVAEASVSSMDKIMKDYLKAQEKIQQAKSFNDLEDVTTAQFIQTLKDKISSDGNETMVLKMTQSLRPDHIKIIDVREQKDHGKLAVTGRSFFGEVQGVVYMTQDSKGWKVDREMWFCGDKAQLIQQKYPLSILSQPTPVGVPVQDQALAILDTPDYTFDKNRLHLRHAHPNIRKRSFMFIFYMDKKDPVKEVAGLSESKAAKSPMHVLWPGPNDMVPEQTVHKYDYPVDFSIADDKDGYMPSNLNLMLPRKKPNGITVSAMWTF
jgi:hypothetical protein